VTGVVIVMGVSGSGKTTLARGLSAALGVRVLEGDSFHPPTNIARMKAGLPLTDEMRWGWLTALGRAANTLRAGGVVASCSALKRSYRDLLRAEAGPLRFLFLDGPAALVAARLQERSGHYMPPTLLASQFATLEPPGPDEPDVIRLSLCFPPETVLRNALAALARSENAS
jgi:gluconokinase